MSSQEKTVPMMVSKKQAEMLVQMCEAGAVKGPDARTLADLYDRARNAVVELAQP